LKLQDGEDSRLPHACETVASKIINGQRLVFGLTSHFRLFMNEQEVYITKMIRWIVSHSQNECQI